MEGLSCGSSITRPDSRSALLDKEVDIGDEYKFSFGCMSVCVSVFELQLWLLLSSCTPPFGCESKDVVSPTPGLESSSDFVLVRTFDTNSFTPTKDIFYVIILDYVSLYLVGAVKECLFVFLFWPMILLHRVSLYLVKTVKVCLCVSPFLSMSLTLSRGSS